MKRPSLKRQLRSATRQIENLQDHLDSSEERGLELKAQLDKAAATITVLEEQLTYTRKILLICRGCLRAEAVTTPNARETTKALVAFLDILEPPAARQVDTAAPAASVNRVPF